MAYKATTRGVLRKRLTQKAGFQGPRYGKHEVYTYYSYLVCYNKAGTYCKASVLRHHIVNDNLYAYGTNNENEAHYLAVVLNAECLQDALRHCRKSDRDFQTHIWTHVPIPRFNAEWSLHTDIAACFASAHTVAQAQLDPTFGPLKQDKVIRKTLRTTGVMRRIDKLVRRLLPDHTARPESR